MPGLSVEWMQQDKFLAAQKLLQAVEQTDAEKTPTKSVIFEVESLGERYSYVLQTNVGCCRKKTKELRGSIQSPDDIPGFFKVEKIKPATTKPKRLTKVHGSLEGKAVLQLLEDA